MKRFLAAVLAATMLVTACPVGNVRAAGKAVTASTKTLKSKVTGLKAKANVDNGMYELLYSWKSIKGVKYQYRYKTADEATYSKKKTVKKAKATISFPSYDRITFQVRAFKTVKGKKQYSSWTTKKLTSEKIDGMFTKKMGLKEGYIKEGIIYQGGWYASDPKCDLTIAIFSNGLVMTGQIIYIISNNGKIDYYGTCELESKTTADGKEYMEVKIPDQGEGRPEHTVGYGFNDEFLITEEGREVVAKVLDVSAAWDLQDETVNGKPTDATIPECSTIEVKVDKEGKAIMHFSWSKIEGATEYEIHYTTDYDEKLAGKAPEKFETETTQALYKDIEIPEKHGAIALSVAAKTEKGLSDFSSYWWWTKDLIDSNVSIEKNSF